MAQKCEVGRKSNKLIQNMQQQGFKEERVCVCIHSGCEQSAFAPTDSNIGQGGVHTHSGHHLLEWGALLEHANKIASNVSIHRHLQDAIQRVQRCKDTLDMILDIHIQKLSARTRDDSLQGEEEAILHRILNSQHHRTLTGNDLAVFMKVVDRNRASEEVGFSREKENIRLLLANIEASVLKFEQSNKELAKELFLKGSHLFREEKRTEAIEYYSRVLQLDPQHFEALHHRGVVFKEQNNYQLAEEDFESCLLLEPSHSTSYSHLTEIEFRRGNKIKALEWCNRALSFNRQDVTHYNNRAYICLKLDRYSDALKDLNTSISLKPNKEAFQLRAEVNSRLGRQKQAENDWEKAYSFTR